MSLRSMPAIGTLTLLIFFGPVALAAPAEAPGHSQLEKKYRSCFQPGTELDRVVDKEFKLDRLKKVDNVQAGPHKVKELVKSDPLSTVGCLALPIYLKPMCWGRTIAKFTDLLLREPTLNRELTRQYINYLKMETGRCKEGYTPEDPRALAIRMPSGLGDEIGSAVSAFMKGAGAYCAQIRKVEGELAELTKDCAPVPDLKGKTLDEAKDYLLTGLPEGGRFSSDLLVLEKGRPVRYPTAEPAYEKVKNLKVVGQEPAPGVLVDRVTTNLGVQL